MSKTFLRLLVVILIILLGLTIWDIYRSKSSKNTIEDKVSVEIKYLEENITDIINYLNNITINMYKVNKIESENVEQGQGIGGQSSSSSSNSGSAGGQSGNSSDQNSSGQGQDQGQGNGESEQSSKQEFIQYQIVKNNILNSDRDVSNWELIKNDIEKLYTSLVTIELDLEEVGVEEKKLLEFSELLDDTIISIKNEEKAESIENLSNLYKYIQEFYPKQDEKKYVYQTKADIIEAYSLVEKEEWNQISEKINSAQDKFTKAAEKSNKKITINKVNLLLKEIKESVKSEDKDIFYIKYKNILDELGNL